MTPEEHAQSRQHCLTASRAKRLLSANYKTWNTLAKEMRAEQRVLGQAPKSIPSLHWGVEHEPWLRAEVWERHPEWEIESVEFQTYRPRHLVDRGTSCGGATETDSTLPLRQAEQTWAEKLPGLPRRLYEALAEAESTYSGAKAQGQLQELCQRLQAAGPSATEAVREMLKSGFANAPSGLYEAFDRCLALSEVPPRAASGREALLIAHCGASPDGRILPMGWGYEGKAPFNPEYHETYRKQPYVPELYVPQVQWSLWVTGWPKWVFASGDPRRNDDGRLVVRIAEPDLELHRRFEELAIRFLETYTAGEEFKPVSGSAASLAEMFK